MLLTDVIVTTPLPPEVREELEIIGLDYLCDGTQADFRRWMREAGLVNVEVVDLTSTVQSVWEARRSIDRSPSHRDGYTYLLDDPRYRLGASTFYIYVRGDKPGSPT